MTTPNEENITLDFIRWCSSKYSYYPGTGALANKLPVWQSAIARGERELSARNNRIDYLLQRVMELKTKLSESQKREAELQAAARFWQDRAGQFSGEIEDLRTRLSGQTEEMDDLKKQFALYYQEGYEEGHNKALTEMSHIPAVKAVDAIYAAWHVSGVDMAGGNWNRFSEMLPELIIRPKAPQPASQNKGSMDSSFIGGHTGRTKEGTQPVEGRP